MASWSQLPGELIVLIANKLPHVSDLVRFGAACSSWRSAIAVNKLLLTPKLPWLMLVDNDIDARGFIMFPTEKTLRLCLPEVRRRQCYGSSYGWLITLGLDLQIHLLNPTSRLQIKLPPLLTLPYEDGWSRERLRRLFIRKAVTSLTSPSSTISEGCIVMVIYSRKKKLAFATITDTRWKILDCPEGKHDDVLYFNGQFYAVTASGYLRVCDISNPHPVAVEFAPPPEGVSGLNTTIYLVEMSGELHMVVRTLTYTQDSGLFNTMETSCFKVYKLVFSTGKWTELDAFDDYGLFLGCNSSFSVLAHDLQECRGNCIYFTEDCKPERLLLYGSDMGVFDFKKKTIKMLYQEYNNLSLFSAPLWITPALW